MKRYTITLGASTSAGGKVTSASSNGSINGARIALEDDVIFCPACKSQGKIKCIGPRIPEVWSGKNVALENDLCVCGCPSPPRLIPNQSLKCQIIEDSDTSAPSRSQVQSAQTNIKTMFDDRYILTDEVTHEPLRNTEYAFRRPDGNVEFGTTDNAGHTHLLSETIEPELIDIFL